MASAAEMCMLMKYFSCLDGQKTWEEVEPVAERTFHPDLVINDALGAKQTREEFLVHMEEFIRGGGWMEFLKVEKKPVGVHYELVFHMPDGSQQRNKNFASFQDGKLIKIQRDKMRQAVRIL